MHALPFACHRAVPEAARDLALGPDGLAAQLAGLGRAGDCAPGCAHAAVASRVEGGAMVRDGSPCYYVWRRADASGAQVAVVAALPLDELPGDASADDGGPAWRELLATGCQVRVPVATYQASPVMDFLVSAACEAEPLYDVTDAAGARHLVWRVGRTAAVESLQAMFERLGEAVPVSGADALAAARRMADGMPRDCAAAYAAVALVGAASDADAARAAHMGLPQGLLVRRVDDPALGLDGRRAAR